MNHFDIFRIGAKGLVIPTMDYSSVHQMHGLSQEDWDLLTQKEPWTITHRQKARSLIAECVNISLTIAGLPAQPLPAQYVAAVISCVVAPANRLVAAMRAPETFDGVAASGLLGGQEVQPVTTEQMVSLVMAYSSGYESGQPADQVDFQSGINDGDPDA